MSKRDRSNNNQPTLTHKCARIDEGNHTALSSALQDPHAWKLLKQYLLTDMTYPEMDDALVSYLGDQYSASDWEEARQALFSGDGDIDFCLKNLDTVMAKHIPPLKNSKSGGQPLHKRSRLENSYLLIEAEEEDDNSDSNDDDRSHVGSPRVTPLPGPLAVLWLAATINDMFTRYQENPPSSSPAHQRAVSSSAAITAASSQLPSRIYLLYLHGTATEYIAEHLRSRKFCVTVSPWVTGQLYVVTDSPRTITKAISPSHTTAVKDCLLVTEEEREVVECSCPKLPCPAWVMIKYGPHNSEIGRIFSTDLPNDMVAVLTPRSRLLNTNDVSDIIHDNEVVGWKYRGESYYMGLLLKNFPCNRLELIVTPHVDNIRLHLESGWDKPFLKKTVVAFSMQFLRVGDWVRANTGALHSELSQVISTDHAFGSVCLEFYIDGRPNTVDFRLQDIEQVFRVGDTVRVVAGPYLGLEGYILQMCEDVFCICQAVSKEEVEISKFYLDHRSLSHTLQPRLLTQQYFKHPLDSGSIEIGDMIEVFRGVQRGQRGIVQWFPKGGTHLWFQDTELMVSGTPSSVCVPAVCVQQTHLNEMLQYTKEKGYDTRPGDIISIPIRFMAKICNQRIELKLQDIATRYGMRLNGAMLEGLELASFCDMPGQQAPTILTWGMVLSIQSRQHLTPGLLIYRTASITYKKILRILVSPSFLGGRLYKRFVSTASPDPFCGNNGPTPEGCIMAFCTSNGAGAQIVHFHIPSKDLSPAPPRKKHQEVLVLDGDHHGRVLTVTRCYSKKSVAEMRLTATDFVTLRFDQIYLVESAQHMNR
ncbi:hypothetical protein EDD22DRAFT_852065 [Suillus occidentalis]|nr:hypothetical protein EDD22DRAFT_852065 [Suillus occidentalis]